MAKSALVGNLRSSACPTGSCGGRLVVTFCLAGGAAIMGMRALARDLVPSKAAASKSASVQESTSTNPQSTPSSPVARYRRSGSISLGWEGLLALRRMSSWTAIGSLSGLSGQTGLNLDFLINRNESVRAFIGFGYDYLSHSDDDISFYFSALNIASGIGFILRDCGDKKLACDIGFHYSYFPVTWLRASLDRSVMVSSKMEILDGTRTGHRLGTDVYLGWEVLPSLSVGPRIEYSEIRITDAAERFPEWGGGIRVVKFANSP